MTAPTDRSDRVRPLRWSLPLVILLLAVAAWAPNDGRSALAGIAGSDDTLGLVEPVSSQLARGTGDVDAAPDRLEPRDPADDEPAEPQPPTRPMARHGELTILATSTDPVLVGYHEAGTRDGLELEPVGQLITNHNATRTTAPPDDPEGTPYLIMHSRGRAAPATSAVDIVMRDDDPVLAPVDGTITDIRDYYLSGRYHDLRVEIAPDDAPELRVIVIHVDEVAVAVGDHVEAGRTELAGTARRFPFFSQIDSQTDPERWPHVHLEVKSEDAARPGDG
jgi:hypothetical protein